MDADRRSGHERRENGTRGGRRLYDSPEHVARFDALLATIRQQLGALMERQDPPWSQSETADEADVYHRKTLDLLKCRRNPDLLTLFRHAEAFGCDLPVSFIARRAPVPIRVNPDHAVTAATTRMRGTGSIG
jgi:hypothetical protein